jgi:nitrite reductase (NADH) large subunit
MRQYVIIGNGPAGIDAIEAIRRVDSEGKITNICAEPYHPYSRPLLPFYVVGQISEDRVYFRPKSFYRDQDVTAIPGDRAVEIVPEDQCVALASGKVVPYDKLLIASGSTPREPPIEGHEKHGIFHLTTLDEARGVVARLPDTKRAIVMGGGPLGLKTAMALAGRGIDTKVIIASRRVMSQVLDTDSAAVIEAKLRTAGIDFMLGRSVVAFDGKDSVEEAILDNDERLKCELVIIGKGLVPNLDFLANTRLVVKNVGIIVNQYMQTSLEGVYAAGDVAETYDLISGKSSVIAVWPRASEQGYCAGYNMAGFPKEYVGTHRMNSLDFEDVSCIVMGEIRDMKPGFSIIVQRDLKRHIYQKIILEEGRIRGAVIIGRIANVGAINRFIRRRVNVEQHKRALLETKSTFIY